MKNINIKNRKARYEFEFIHKFEAGIMLYGSEIKSIRNADVSINEAFCYMKDGEVFIKNMYIKEYKYATHTNHEERRDRKLLLNKHELKKISNELKNQSITIVPLNLFINAKGLAKINIAVSRGKKIHDKRESIKKRDLERETARKFK
jgi:SsrA-binding protein